MTEDRKVLVGIDLCDDITQISCYRRDMDKVIPVGRLVGREREYECPTVLSYQPVKKEWLFGTEALLAAEREEVYLFRDILKQISRHNKEACDISVRKNGQSGECDQRSIKSDRDRRRTFCYTASSAELYVLCPESEKGIMAWGCGIV